MLFLLIFFVVILHSFIHIVVDINYNTLCLCLSVALRPPTAIDFGTHGTALPFRGSVLELSGFLGGRHHRGTRTRVYFLYNLHIYIYIYHHYMYMYAYMHIYRDRDLHVRGEERLGTEGM